MDETPAILESAQRRNEPSSGRAGTPGVESEIKYQIQHNKTRRIVKPGITAWAQVNGIRGDTNQTQRIIHNFITSGTGLAL